jgi:hypothetical protein
MRMRQNLDRLNAYLDNCLSADCAPKLRAATSTSVCTGPNGFAGPGCPILSVANGSCGELR